MKVPLSIFFCLIFFLFFLPEFLPASIPKEEYRQIQKELKRQKKKLETVIKTEQSVVDDLRKKTAELSSIERELLAQRGEIKKIQTNISAHEADIEVYSRALDLQSSLLKKRLRILQRMSRETDTLIVLLIGVDAHQTLRMMRYLEDIAEYDYNLINRHKETISALTKKQNELKRLFGELKKEEAKIIRLEGSVREKKKERETLLIAVRKEKGYYENMIKEMQDASEKLLRIIQEAERREKELKKKKAAGRRDIEKEEEKRDDSEFTRLKGRLPMPVNGAIALQYGTQVDPVFNLPVFRSGIHIKSPIGSPVRAVQEGKIVFADDFKGYGQLIIISHGGGYHTLYGNMSRIFFKNGVIIKEGETIGEVGDSSTLGMSALYFEIRYKGKPLDPQQWLKR